MGLSRHFVPYLGLMALYGTALTVVQTAITTMLQEHTEADMQGRVFGLLSTMYAGCPAFGHGHLWPPGRCGLSAVDHGRAGGAILAAAAAVGTDHRMRGGCEPNRDRAFPSGKARSLLAHTMFQK